MGYKSSISISTFCTLGFPLFLLKGPMPLGEREIVLSYLHTLLNECRGTYSHQKD